MFAVPKSNPPLIAVVGAGECDGATYQGAYEVGRLLAEGGCIVVTGGRFGVMEGASAGAASAGATVVGILPGDSRELANPHVTIPIVTGMGEARNAIIARTCDGMIAVGGEFGTLSEIAFALKFGKPVISLKSWNVAPQIERAETPQEAVSILLQRMRTS